MIPHHVQYDFVDMGGYIYFWPDGHAEKYDAETLRAIADELDRRNVAADEAMRMRYGVTL